MSMLEPQLALFQMQAEAMLSNAIELCRPAFGKAPEEFNSVDVIRSRDELVVSVVAPEIHAKTDVHQSAVTAPGVGVGDAVNIGFLPIDRLQRCLGGMGSFGVDTIAAFEQSKDDSPTRNTASTFATNPSGTEVKFIDLKLSSRWQAFDAPLGLIDNY